MKHHFKHVGPNGTHICIAFEVLGPSIRFSWEGLTTDYCQAGCRTDALGSEFSACDIIHSGALLSWMSLLDATQFSETHLHVKLADLGAGNNFIHLPS
jgi:hypothetical protein